MQSSLKSTTQARQGRRGARGGGSRRVSRLSQSHTSRLSRICTDSAQNRMCGECASHVGMSAARRHTATHGDSSLSIASHDRYFTFGFEYNDCVGTARHNSSTSVGSGTTDHEATSSDKHEPFKLRSATDFNNAEIPSFLKAA